MEYCTYTNSSKCAADTPPSMMVTLALCWIAQLGGGLKGYFAKLVFLHDCVLFSVISLKNAYSFDVSEVSLLPSSGIQNDGENRFLS